MAINKTLWPHQKKGVDFAQERNAAMLAMGMRSGKTLTTLQLIETVNARLVLIVAGKHPVQYVWQKQIADHTDWNDHAQIIDLTVGSIPKRTEKLQARTDALLTVVLINYEVTHREPLYAALRAIAWDIVVVDDNA